MDCGWLDSRIADEMKELLLVFDQEGKILFGNRTAADKLEYGKDELTNCTLRQIFRHNFPDEQDGISDFLDDCRDETREFSMYRSNNSCFSVNIHIVPETEQGIVILLAEDITAQKNLNTRIRKLKEEEVENSRIRNEFTANITHELRTPVNGIKGHVLALLDEVQEEEQRKTLELILYCCNNMSAIISDVLDYAKLETGKFTIEEKEFDFYKMMDRVIATHSAETNRKELRLSVDIDENIPRLLIGDELRLEQILNNLISNAVKFTMVGYVNIVVSKAAQVSDEVEMFFMVKDSGIGISQKEQDKLFQSFSQVDASITRRFGGCGLGLSITKQLVGLMQGEIHVQSEKGKGSAFSFSVRLRTNQNPDDRQHQAYMNWSKYTNEENEMDTDGLMQFGEQKNKEELEKRMNKLVLSIELGAWDKAEMLATTVKALIENGGEDIKKQVLRLEMAIRKCNYEKSMAMYEKLKEALAERFGDA